MPRTAPQMHDMHGSDSSSMRSLALYTFPFTVHVFLFLITNPPISSLAIRPLLWMTFAFTALSVAIHDSSKSMIFNLIVTICLPSWWCEYMSNSTEKNCTSVHLLKASQYTRPHFINVQPCQSLPNEGKWCWHYGQWAVIISMIPARILMRSFKCQRGSNNIFGKMV